MNNKFEHNMQAQVNIKYISADMPYAEATALQEELVQNIIEHTGPETLIFCEHAPVYTAGTSANIEKDHLGNNDIPLIKTGRGGEITYHGTGQRVLYPLLDLRERTQDLRKYICDLQTWIINTLRHFNIEAYGDDLVGVWVDTDKGPCKIAAIGVRVRKWVTFHGVALNINPNLAHYQGIIPCGIHNKGITSMADLGFTGTIDDVDAVLKTEFEKQFHCKL